MPVLGAPQTPSALSAGQKIAVLNNENLGAGALTMAVALTPQPGPVNVMVVNETSATVQLMCSADGTNFYQVCNAEGNLVAVQSGQAWLANAVGGLFYAVKAGGAIAAGTVWLSM